MNAAATVRKMQGVESGVRSELAVAPLATIELVRRIRAGDGGARDLLFRRYLPLLRRWAHGRLPLSARDANDTDDLVQVTLLRALNRIEDFDVRHPGSFLAYLRQILLNEVRAELRKRRVRGDKIDLETVPLADETESIVEQLVGHERLRSFERALGELEREDQALIIMRLELGMSYPEIGIDVGLEANTVRMRITRAFKKIASRIAAERD